MENEIYYPIQEEIPKLKKRYGEDQLNYRLYRRHEEEWNGMQFKEREQEKLVLQMEKETNAKVADLHKQLNDTTSKKKAKRIKNKIKMLKHDLEQQKVTLFYIKIKKRRIGKSFVAFC